MTNEQNFRGSKTRRNAERDVTQNIPRIVVVSTEDEGVTLEEYRNTAHSFRRYKIQSVSDPKMLLEYNARKYTFINVKKFLFVFFLMVHHDF